MKKDFPNLAIFTKGSAYETLLGLQKKDVGQAKDVL